ncbi:MAG: T9SS type A sorting domain-containing protein [Bacteroidetes bacterium]|nr:T9SS type A sorting domain-containing protein [Bacteroidota bacterium]
MGPKIFKSINNGASWTDLQLAISWNPTTILQHSGALYVGTANMGVYKSIDGGLTWSNVSNGITPNVVVNAFASIGNYLFAATYDGVYVTTNNGVSWTAASNGLTTTYIQSLTVNGNSLFAGSSSGGVFKSTNNGTNWTNVNNGVLPIFNLTVETLGSSIFAGYHNGLIFISNDDGLTWNNKDIPTTNFGSFCFTVDGNTIYAGTSNGGVFKDSTFTSGLSSPENSVMQITAYPNPASDYIELSISQKNNSSRHYEISNVVGQVLKTIQIDQMSYSNNKVRIDISDLPSGYYILSDKIQKGIPVKFVKL